jgi:cytochrome c553
MQDFGRLTIGARRSSTREARWTRLAIFAAVAAGVGLGGSLPVAAFDGAQLASEGNGESVPACASCHGEKGEGQPESGFPRLAGLNSEYLLRQLRQFASGDRANEIMGPVAKELDDASMASVAAFYGSAIAEKAPHDTETTPEQIALGASIATVGDWPRGLPACGQCHGPAGQGVGSSFPAIAGQSQTYISSQLVAWKEGARSNDPLNLMTGVASKLDDDQLAAVSAYYASLPFAAAPKAVEGDKP